MNCYDSQGSSKQKYLLLGLLIGVCLGFGIGFSSCYLWKHFSSVEESHEKTNNNSVQVITYGKSPTETELFAPQPKKSDLMYDKVRVLCWVLTSPSNFQTKAKAVKETWGKRSNKILFMSSEEDPSLPSIKLPNVKEGRDELWGKTREAFRYIWENYRDDYDCFYKADDDTYAIMENMRYFLSAYDTNEPMWFGYKFKAIVKQGYFSGGSGYILSKEALRRFAEIGYHDPTKCRSDHHGAEDVEMGKCMENLKVKAMDTRDSKGRNRFFPLSTANSIFLKKSNSWNWGNMYFPIIEEGLPGCCSDSAISFHYIDETQMYAHDYLIYQLKPYGANEAENRQSIPDPPPDLNLTATPWVLPK